MAKGRVESIKGAALTEWASVATAVSGVFVIFGLVFGAYIFIDKKYALATDLYKLETRVEVHELRHLYHDALNDVYFFKKQSRIHPSDEKIYEKLREAEDLAEGLKRKMDKSNTKQTHRSL